MLLDRNLQHLQLTGVLTLFDFAGGLLLDCHGNFR